MRRSIYCFHTIEERGCNSDEQFEWGLEKGVNLKPVGYALSAQQCAVMVKITELMANGVAFVPSDEDCYAIFNATGSDRDENNYWQTCIFIGR